MSDKPDLSLKIVELGGVYAKTADLYDSIFKQLEAPQWVAFNRDALFDVLTAELKTRVRVIWKGYDQVLSRHFSDNRDIASVLADAAAENPDLELVLKTGPAAKEESKPCP